MQVVTTLPYLVAGASQRMDRVSSFLSRSPLPPRLAQALHPGRSEIFLPLSGVMSRGAWSGFSSCLFDVIWRPACIRGGGVQCEYVLS